MIYISLSNVVQHGHTSINNSLHCMHIYELNIYIFLLSIRRRGRGDERGGESGEDVGKGQGLRRSEFGVGWGGSPLQQKTNQPRDMCDVTRIAYTTKWQQVYLR